MIENNVTQFHNPSRDYIRDQARDAFVELSQNFTSLRLSLESMTINELLLFRAQFGAFTPLNLDGWRSMQAVLEIIGGVMATRHDTNPEPGRSNTMPFPEPD